MVFLKMKGFLLSVLLLGAGFYFISASAPKGKGAFFASATGQAIEVTAANFDYAVTHSEAPVLAYYWSPT